MNVAKSVLVLLWLALVASLAVAFPDNPLLSEQHYYAPKAMTPPVLDGDLSDWQGAEDYSFFVGPSEIERIGNTYGWIDEDLVGPGFAISCATNLLDHTGIEGAEANTDQDCSATIYQMYDDRNLYVAAEFTDNYIDVEGAEVDDPEQAWQVFTRDGLWLWFDVPDDGDGQTWIDGDIAFAFAACPQSHAFWTAWVRDANAELAAPVDVVYGFQQTEVGYNIEAVIPFSILTMSAQEVELGTGSTLGFSLLLLDPDGGESYGGQLFWAMGGEIGGFGEASNDRWWTELTLWFDEIDNYPTAVESSSWGAIKSSF